MGWLGEKTVIEPRPEVSVIVPTCNRLEQMERCLRALFRQSTARKFEIIVVDNAPQTGRTRELIERFPETRLMVESRPGPSFARNAGVRAARGEIVVFADDDTEAEPDWLDHLLRPFERPQVAAVTGNTLPRKVETEAERIFEAYGGFSRGSSAREFAPSWLQSHWWWLPLWQVGGLGNAAFRASVFRDPAVGLLDECLGGSPIGSWEDLYFFYRLLRGGHLIVYEPRAAVWHAHRERLAELSRQLEAYRCGEVVFCLLLIGRHRDWRGLAHLLLWIPFFRAMQLAAELLRRVRGQRRFPLRMLVREWWAYFDGPAALIVHRKVPGGLPMRRQEPPLPALERHRPAGASIVIPVYNAVEFAQACVESVYEAQTSVPFEVIVVDNGSGPEVAAWLARERDRRPGLVALHFDQPLGFARAVNEGARRAKHDTLVLLNSDTLATDGWLDGLENALAFDPQLGVVSPVTNYAGNDLQMDPEAAALDPPHARRYAARIRDRRELLPEPQRLVFFCVMIRRAVWELLDGLDEAYVQGNSEDNDFCLRARLAGYRLAIARNAFVFHHRGSPTFRANAIDHDAAMTRNQLLFCDRASSLARSLKFFDGRGSQWLPNLSVIVPVMGDRADDLRDSLASLVNQTARGFQTIVVAPRREELATLTQSFEGRLRIANVVVDEKLRDRPAALLNAGLRAAERQWIAYLPAGDIYHAYHIELLAEALRGSQAEAVYSAWTLVERTTSEGNGRQRRAVVALHGTAPDQLGLDNQPPLLCWMHDRETVSDKGFDESFRAFAGLEFVLRMSRQLRVQYIPRVTCERRLDPERARDPLRVTQARRLLETFPSSEPWQGENRVRFLEAVEAGTWEEFPLLTPRTPHPVAGAAHGGWRSDSRFGHARNIQRVAVGAAREAYRALVPLQIRYGIERRVRHVLGLPPILRTDWQKLNAACDALAKAILQTTRLPRPPGPPDVLLFSVIQWDHLVQRPHHFAKGLASRGHRVYWVDIRLTPPDRLDPASLVREIEPGLFYVELPGAGGELYQLEWSAAVLAAMEMAVVHIRATCGIQDAIQLVNFPKWAPLVFRLRDRFGWPIVYDCLDDQKAFSDLFKQDGAHFEDELAQRCELLVTCSRLLDEDRRRLNPNTVLILNAADYHLFHSAQPAGLLRHLPRPIVGFFGALSDWLDLDWVAQSAQRFPHWSFVYIGRQGFSTAATRERWKSLASTANIHVFPQTDPRTLATYLAEFDVCTMPFLLLPVTRVMNAVKIYEYLAAGKPVVLANVAELRPLAKLGLISMYRDSEHSFRLLEQAVQAPASAEKIATLAAFASENTWAKRVDQLEAAFLTLTASAPSVEDSGVENTRRAPARTSA